MKGIIFNLFENYISEEFSEGIFNEIIEETELITKEPFVGPGTYPDSDLLALIQSTSKILNMSIEQVLKGFGKGMFCRVIKKYPMFVKNIAGAKEFLKTVHSVIHVEVKKLYPEAETPNFIYHDPSEDILIIEYHSKRRLCHLMEGLLDGTAEHFKTAFKYSQSRCMHRGDDICVFDIDFKINEKTDHSIEETTQCDKKLRKKIEILQQKNNILEEMTESRSRDLYLKNEMLERLNIELLSKKEQLDSTVLVSETDLNGIITYANEQFCQISKYTKEELIGKSHNIVNSKKHSKEFWKTCWDTISSGNIWKGEVCNKAKDGTFYWVQASILPIFNAKREIVNYSAIRIDITAKKETEQKQKEHDLKLSFLGKIAREIGHEINTPLAIIQMNAGLMRLNLSKEEGINQNVIQAIDTIEKTVTRISDIAKGLKIIGRSSQTAQEPIDAHESILSITGLIQGIYKIENIDVEVKSQAHETIFQGEHGKFHQVITNLLSNARDALAELETPREKKIVITLKNENNHLAIFVSDNANGILPDNLENIFKEDFTTKGVGEGTGIGLSISKSIIENIGGEIFVKSQVGKGTIFKISLPLIEKRTQESKNKINETPNDEIPEDISFKGNQDQKLQGKILVVDDNKDMRDLLCMTIESFGCEVTQASDGLEALEKLEKNQFDVLLTDLRMPRLTGEELLEKIKELQMPNLKIIALSGEISPFLLKENQGIIKEMANIFLEKPISREGIFDALTSLLAPSVRKKD